VVFLAVIAGLVALAFSGKKPSGPSQPSEYAKKLKLSDVSMSTADTFVGGKLLYVEGRITDVGDKTVTHATIRAVFKDDMNQVVLDFEQPLLLTTQRQDYVDTSDLSRTPLAPGQTGNFRLTFEHVPVSWNGAYPDLKVVQVSTK
jgi:hypothetical protein